MSTCTTEYTFRTASVENSVTDSVFVATSNSHVICGQVTTQTLTWFMKHAMISPMLAIISFTESDTTSHPHTVDTPSVKSGTRFIILCSSHPQPTLTANTSFTLRSTAW